MTCNRKKDICEIRTHAVTSLLFSALPPFGSNVDEYGFERPAEFNLEEYDRFISAYLSVLTRRNIKWRRLLGNGRRELRQNATTKRYIRKGVPAEYRARVRY